MMFFLSWMQNIILIKGDINYELTGIQNPNTSM